MAEPAPAAPDLAVASPAAGGLGAPDSFVAALSHELRTPLAGLIGMTRLLQGTRLTAEQRAYVEAAAACGEHLTGLVNDLLDLAKLDSGAFDLAPAPTDVERLLQETCELLAPRAQDRGLELAWAADPLPPLRVDAARLRQVVFNLVGNAVKFTEAGGVLVEAQLAGSGETARLVLSVTDTGPGVPEAARARIFEPFGQADVRHGRAFGGAGLGLAVVRRIAELAGGSVRVETAPGGGSRFVVEMAAPAAGGRPSARPLAGVRVAVVSPDPFVRAAAVRQTEACGGEAREAADAADLGSGWAQVVLADAAAVRGRAGAALLARGAPVLVLLTPQERRAIPQRRAQGFAGYLIKPLRRASLAARVLAALGRAPEPAELDDRTAAAAAAAPGLRVLLAEDDPINALLARKLMEREGCAVTVAADGEAALEQAAVQAFDLIVLDVRLPKLDGREAARRLRARGYAGPLLALTAEAFEAEHAACLAAGMDAVLTKPLSAEALRAALARSVRAAA